MKKYRREHHEPWVAVDAGNLLFENGGLDPNLEQQGKITAAGIVQAYKQMGYDAAGLGVFDLAAGLHYLLELQKKSAFPWLSANLVRTANHRPFFAPSLVLRRGGLSFGIIGITGKAVQSMLTAKDGAVLLPWSEVLPPLIAKLAKRCDFIILLSGLAPQTDIDIALKLTGIDLIVEAGNGYGNKNPALVGNTLITHTNVQGKSLGILQVNWQPSKIWQPQDLQPQMASQRELLHHVDLQLKRIRALGDPAVLFKNAPGRLAWYRQMVKRRDRIAAQLKGLTAKLAAGRKAPPGSTFTASFVAMEASLPDDPRVLARVEAIKGDITALGRKKAASETGPRAGGKLFRKGYIGWQRCTACHRAIVEKWQRTAHARAYDSLLAKGQQFNRDCLACHVTGVLTGKEPYALTLPAALRQVGCEACHGPCRSHVEDGSPPIQRRPGKSVCLRCHTPARDDNFVYGKKKLLVH